MIDSRRLSTEQAVAAGILDLEPAESVAPGGRSEYLEADYLETPQGFEGQSREDNWRLALERGMGLHALMFYGSWIIWPDGDAFSGELVQYRAMTDSFQKRPIAEALEKAAAWFRVCYG